MPDHDQSFSLVHLNLSTELKVGYFATDNKEIAWIYLGQRPMSQDDRWIVYGQRPWVYLYRSWTKLPVFMFAFSGNQVKDALVFSTALKEGTQPESMTSNLESWLRQAIQQANHILDTSEAKTAFLRGR